MRDKYAKYSFEVKNDKFKYWDGQANSLWYAIKSIKGVNPQRPVPITKTGPGCSSLSSTFNSSLLCQNDFELIGI